MVRIEPNKLIIEIDTITPIEDLITLQQSFMSILLEQTLLESQNEEDRIKQPHWYYFIDFLMRIMFLPHTNEPFYYELLKCFNKRFFPKKQKPEQ